MEEEVAAFILKRAPGRHKGEWHQKSLKRLLERWAATRPDDYDTVRNTPAFSGVVGYKIYASELGQYGYDTNYRFTPDLDPQFVEDEVENADDLATELYEEWVDELEAVIREDQEASLFTPKELAVLIASRNPRIVEREAADALGITVGTYRGKLGRVKDKLKEARASLDLVTGTDVDDPDDWCGNGYLSPLPVLTRVDEDRLPITAARTIGNEDSDEIPLEMLIYDDSRDDESVSE